MTLPHEQLAAALAEELHQPAMAATLGPALRRLMDRGLCHLGPVAPSEAEALWAALDVPEGCRVVEAVLIGKLVNFASAERKPPSMSVAATDGMDWVQQYGMLHGAIKCQDSLPWDTQ